MEFDDANRERFEEMMRSIAEEVGRSVQRAADHVDVEEIAHTIGVDPDRAREWFDTAAGWLRAQAEDFGEDVAAGTAAPDGPGDREGPGDRGDGSGDSAGRVRHAQRDDPLRAAGAHPLDLPTDEQGAALAGLDSGRWIVEPGSESLAARGEGPAPSDALGLCRELRVRDWISPDGELTLAGRHALSRWLDAASMRR